MPRCAITEGFFRLQLDQMIALRHPLVVVASRMARQPIDASVALLFARQARAGLVMPDLDLFGQRVECQLRVSVAGRPRVPLRIMISLLYLNHAVDEAADEGEYEQFAQTITPAEALGLIKPQEMSCVIVDTTVQHKAVARRKLVEAAKAADIDLKQTFAEEGRALARQAGRYAHARQFRRMRRVIRRQATLEGRLVREIEQKTKLLGQAVRQALQEPLTKAQRIVAQSGQRQAAGGQRKLYAWHAPELECIGKGKVNTPDEFGIKVGIVSRLHANLIVGPRAFAGNPYDDYTLASILMREGAVKPVTAFVDLGYRGVEVDSPHVHIVHRGKRKRISPQDNRQLSLRQAIEPIIGHLKPDHRMDRCYLKGGSGDRLRAVLCAAGYNIGWLLRMIAKKGCGPCWRFFCACRSARRWGSHASAALVTGKSGARVNILGATK